MELFDNVRARCPANAWSQGVTLSRNGAVSWERFEPDEAVARIDLKGTAVSPRVSLYTEELEWDCDCASRLEACEHVAAAVIAMKRAREGDDGLPVIEEPAPRLVYRFRRTPEGLSFERALEIEGAFRAVDVSLSALAAGRFDGPRVDATPEDMAVEKALGVQLSGVLERSSFPRLFAVLPRSADVTLDGSSVRASVTPLLPTVRVDEYEGGFLLSLRLEEGAEVFRNGVALLGGELRPVGEPELSGTERYQLEKGWRFSRSRSGELVGEVLPSLGKRLPVDVRAALSTETVRETPRLSLRCQKSGDELYVLPSIVYGDPPVARVEGERFVTLGSKVPLRDTEAEQALAERLRRTYGLELGAGELLAPEDAVRFVSGLERFRGHLEGDGLQFFHLAPSVVPRVEIRGRRVEAFFEVEEKEERRRANASAVVRAWGEGKNLVPLTDGGFSPLPVAWLDSHGRLLSDLLAARDAKGDVPRAGLADLARLCQELDEPPPPDFEKLQGLVEGFSAVPEADLDGPVATALRSYQRDGVNRLAFLRDQELGALLADDMGLGKTIQALAVLRRRAIVVAPTSVLHNWKAEAERFRPDLSVTLYYGPDRKLDPEADLVLTTHALLRLDREVLSGEEWNTVVLDEAQAIKNPESQLARAACSLRARWRLALTGTPIENRLEELWSHFHFLSPGFLGDLSDFRERYVRPIEDGETDVLAHLRRRVQPFFLRRRKQEVAPELPPRTEITLRAELGEEERILYDALRLSAHEDVAARLQRGASPLRALETLLRLRQAACHRGLVPGQTADTSSKTELLLTELETAVSDGHRSLVFSQWTSLLDLLEPHLNRSGYDYLRLDGSTEDRQGVVERFQREEGPPVLLISLKAGGVGLNLTAADHVFLLDPWWNPAVEAQAADRAHRIGQDKPVTIYRLIAAETVEEKIQLLQEKKKELSELATAGSSPLTREDLLFLLDS